MSQTYINQLVHLLFTLQLTNKLYHWNTTQYRRHLVTDQFQTILVEWIDRFVETYIGKYNKKPRVSSIDIPVLSDENSLEMFEITRRTLEQMDQFIRDSELLALRDDLVAHMNQTIYLLRFQ
jgi:hypothetical protein